MCYDSCRESLLQLIQSYRPAGLWILPGDGRAHEAVAAHFPNSPNAHVAMATPERPLLKQAP